MTARRLVAVHTTVALALVACASTLGACGGDDSDEPTAKPPGESLKPPASEAAKAKLSRRGSPGAAVLELWRYVQVGAIPAAVFSYDRRVRRGVGPAYLAGALQTQQPVAARLTPEVVLQDKTPRGTLVVVNATGEDVVSRQISYILRRDGKQWKILYDTLLEKAIPEYVQQRAQPDLTPAQAAKERDRGVLKQGQDKLIAYRLAALGQTGSRRRRQSNPSPAPQTPPASPPPAATPPPSP